MFCDVLNNVKYIIFAGNSVRMYAYCIAIREIAVYWWKNKFEKLLDSDLTDEKMTKNYVLNNGNLLDPEKIPKYIDVKSVYFKNYIVTEFVKNNIKGFGATSSGSIISFFLSFKTIPFKRIINECRRSSKYFLQNNLLSFDINRLFLKGGLFNHEILYKELQDFMIKNNISPSLTFKEHYELTNLSLTYNAVCFGDGSTLLMNYQTTPNLKVIDAIMATTALPILYPPYKINDKYYVDGGMSINYLLQLYPENESFGITMGNENDPDIINYYGKICGLTKFNNDDITGGIDPIEEINTCSGFVDDNNSDQIDNITQMKNLTKIITGGLSFSLNHITKLNLEKLNLNQLNRTIYIKTPYILTGDHLLPTLKKDTKKAFNRWLLNQIFFDIILSLASFFSLKTYNRLKHQI